MTDNVYNISSQDTQFQEHLQHVPPVPRNGEKDSELKSGSPDAVLVFLLDPEHPQKFCLGILLLLLM